MSNFERNVGAVAGASFSRSSRGRVLFQFTIDPASVIGPREATRADKAAHPTAWQAFASSEGIDPLDLDALDGPGGSLPAETPAPRPRGRPRKLNNEPAEHHSDGG